MKLSDDDIEAYLTTYERMMAAFRVAMECWAFKLAPQLTGKEQQAHALMATENTGEYNHRQCFTCDKLGHPSQYTHRRALGALSKIGARDK